MESTGVLAGRCAVVVTSDGLIPGCASVEEGTEPLLQGLKELLDGGLVLVGSWQLQTSGLTPEAEEGFDILNG